MSTPSLPDPDARRRAVAAALANTKIAKAGVAPPNAAPKTDEERSKLRLMAATEAIYKMVEAVVVEARDKLQMPYNHDHAQDLMHKLWMETLDKESREGLRYQLSFVLTDMLIERIDELQFYPGSEDGNPKV